MHNGIINKTRYDDLEKLIKQISFIVKKPGGNLPENQFTIVKKSCLLKLEDTSTETISIEI